MLEDFVSTLVAEQRRSLCPNADLDGYCDRLVELGYSGATIRHKLWIVGTFLAWMAGRQLRTVRCVPNWRIGMCRNPVCGSLGTGR